MRDRAGGVGGRLSVESAPGKGTVIEMEVPGG
jgi:signal transduction histidine kinase